MEELDVIVSDGVEYLLDDDEDMLFTEDGTCIYLEEDD